MERNPQDRARSLNYQCRKSKWLICTYTSYHEPIMLTLIGCCIKIWRLEIMKVTVNYLAQLKQVAGIPSENIVVDEAYSVRDLVQQVAKKHGEPLRSFLLDTEGSLRNSILVIVGDEQVHWETPMQLNEGDEISFLSPLAGG